MKALQKFNPDTDTWENVFNRPLGDNEAQVELERQQGWAEEDGVTAEFRLVDVELAP